MYNIENLYKRGYSESFINLVATQYAVTPCEYSREYFKQKFFITDYFFSKIIECAIIYNLVDDNIVNKTINKAYTNSIIRCKRSGRRVLKHFSKLINDRNYLLELNANEISIEKNEQFLDYKTFLEEEFNNYSVDGTDDISPSIEYQLKNF